jgi:hypothetical protein
LHQSSRGIFQPLALRRDRHSYLLRYAQVSSWREDNRRTSNGEQVSRVAGLALKPGQERGFYRLLAAAHLSGESSVSAAMYISAGHLLLM